MVETSDYADWTMAARVLETLMRTQKARDISELRGWAGKVDAPKVTTPRQPTRHGARSEQGVVTAIRKLKL